MKKEITREIKRLCKRIDDAGLLRSPLHPREYHIRGGDSRRFIVLCEIWHGPFNETVHLVSREPFSRYRAGFDLIHLECSAVIIIASDEQAACGQAIDYMAGYRRGK